MKGGKNHMKTTKILIPLFAVMLLSGCATTHENNNFPLDSASNSHDVYAFEAATSVGLLNDALNDTNLKAKMSKKELTPDVIDEIASYLPSIEAALTGVDSLVTSISAESDLTEYETMMTVTYQDINSIKNTFVMYYNETILNDDDHDEDEQESYIEGIIKIDDQIYQMRGEKEIEQDEFEISFTYRLDEQTYVIVEQEIEGEKTEFQYEIVKNGESIYEYSLEVKRHSVELEVENQTIGEKEMEFYLFEKDGKTLIKAEVEDNEQEYEILFEKVIDVETGNVNYIVIN